MLPVTQAMAGADELAPGAPVGAFEVRVGDEPADEQAVARIVAATISAPNRPVLLNNVLSPLAGWLCSSYEEMVEGRP
jgi:hypothetical protein